MNPALLQRFLDPPAHRPHIPGGVTPWPRKDAMSAGFAPGFTEAIDAARASQRAASLHGLTIIRGGKLVLDAYGAGPDFSWGKPLGEVTFDPSTLHDIRSVTKSVVALLYGIALERGQVPAPDAPLLAQFPEYPDLVADPARAGLRIEHALTMTWGLEWREQPPYTDPSNGEIAMMLAEDRWRYALERPVIGEPGRHWNYCGGATEILGRLIAKGTGQDLHEFARTALFDPLGISAFEWLAGADAVASAASGLRLAPLDLARIGQLVLQDGRWANTQVVPTWWLEQVLQPHTHTEWGTGYGYGWYLEDDGPHRWVGGIGNGDQRLSVFPELELVVVITTGDYDHSDGALVRTLIDGVLGHLGGNVAG